MAFDYHIFPIPVQAILIPSHFYFYFVTYFNFYTISRNCMLKHSIFILKLKIVNNFKEMCSIAVILLSSLLLIIVIISWPLNWRIKPPLSQTSYFVRYLTIAAMVKTNCTLGLVDYLPKTTRIYASPAPYLWWPLGEDCQARLVEDCDS